MQIPILNGIYTDANSDFRSSYPVNLVPVPVDNGISKGYLRPAEGVVATTATPPGVGRSGIEWRGFCYRVMGSKLARVNPDDSILVIGDVGPGRAGLGAGGVHESIGYSFDYLAVTSGGRFYLYDGTTLTQVTDPDLGGVVDFIWVDGYFLCTDGVNLIVTELNDPFSVLPTKYGSSEADPDPVKAIVKIRNEPHVLNRYTIEVFDNIGGTGFPFQRVDGAQVQRGTVGTYACCEFLEALAFVGGGRDEGIAVWLASGGSTARLSTREIDTILAEYPEAILAQMYVESRVYRGHQHLLLHLPDKTLVYDGAATGVVGEPVWFVLSSGVTLSKYKAQHIVRCYDKWHISDPDQARLGILSEMVHSHWGVNVTWQFSTVIIYNESRRALIHELELVALTGRATFGDNPTLATDYSTDGLNWSNPKYISAGKQGNASRRLVWMSQGGMTNWRIQRFTGQSDGATAFARLEARIEGLAY